MRHIAGLKDRDNSEALGIFLDISAVFDQVDHNYLLFKLFNIGTPMHLLKPTSLFLLHRTFQVILHGTLSNTRNINSGLPQVSILNPILYNIFTRDFLATNSAVAMFADNTALLIPMMPTLF